MRPEMAQYPGSAPIDAYGNGGFRFAGMSHRGSILCLPHAIVAWAADDPRTVTPASFAPVLECKTQVRILLLGTGRAQVFPSEAVRAVLREAGIAVEPMNTGAACRTYNVLLAEGRPVAAALIAVD
jgi:uncharacterized protein